MISYFHVLISLLKVSELCNRNFTKIQSESSRKPITPVYPYGHQTMNFADNSKIILSTKKYIKETRRFST